MARRLALVLLALLPVRAAWGTSSGPIQLAPSGDAVWVINPDSDTVARIDPATDTRVDEVAVGKHPRTVAVTAGGVYVTNQGDDTVERLGDPPVPLPFGCRPYGIVADAAGDELYVFQALSGGR